MSELYHHGILGMKWGVRRFQNKDGTRTSLGKRHKKQLSDGIEKAQHHGSVALKRFSSISGKYDSKINKAVEKGDYGKAEKLEEKFNSEMSKKVYSYMYKQGYQWVNEGYLYENGNTTLNLQFGKYNSEKEIKAGKKFVEDYMISNSNYIAFDLTDDD